MTGKVLIIDDSPTVRESLSLMLTQEGFTVTSASTGEEGLEKAKSQRPDVIILDTVLPQMNGLEVCRAIKSSRSSIHSKIIITTGVLHRVDPYTAKDAGCDEYIVKTSDFMPLLMAVKRLMPSSL